MDSRSGINAVPSDPGAAFSDDPTNDPGLPELPTDGIPDPGDPRRYLLSGTYVQRWRDHGPAVTNVLRLDVDRSYPQMMASGRIFLSPTNSVEWVARVSRLSPGVYQGQIWYQEPFVWPGLLTYIRIEVPNVPDMYRSAILSFSSVPSIFPAAHVYRFTFESPFFRTVNFEFDHTPDSHPVLSINLHAHPNHAPGLPPENLSVENVYQRAGIGVTRSARDGVVPISMAGSNATWNNLELLDAMVVYWSRFSYLPQWALWTLFTGLADHAGLAGVMFDVVTGNQRRGCAIFTEVWNQPAGDPAPAAWVDRMRFYAACHESGHIFNLLHSFQKDAFQAHSWIGMNNEPEARSFMNYPQNVAGGTAAFFSSFRYRFSDDELLFMRHAPEAFVIMDWYPFGSNHALIAAGATTDSNLRLGLRIARARPTYEFAEPVVVELHLSNAGEQPVLVDENLLRDAHNITLVIARRGGAVREWRPFAEGCYIPRNRVLAPGETVAESYRISADARGWAIAEPGFYTVRAAVELKEEAVISNAVEIRVAPPKGYDQEYFAQDFFSTEVASTLAFDGSRVRTDTNALLAEAAERFAGSRAALHAGVALGMPLARSGRVLTFKGDERAFTTVAADPKRAADLLSTALMKNPASALETFGGINYARYMNELATLLDGMGRKQEAGEVRAVVAKAMR